MYTPETVLAHAGINNVLNDKSQSNTENLVSNIKCMVDKCRKFGVKNMFVWFGFHHKSIVRSVEKNP